MSQPYKICPICRTPSHRNAALCSTCGATLTDTDLPSQPAPPTSGKPVYNAHFGETDLFEGSHRSRGETVFMSALLLVVLVACAGAAYAAASRVFTAASTVTGANSPNTSGIATVTAVPTRGGASGAPVLPMVTNTLRPTPDIATVTPAPPTPEPTATQGPCSVQVQSGDDLISLAASCGHRSMDVIPLILELNELSAPENIQVGQVLEIPYPTATVDPNSLPTEEVESGDGAAPTDADGTIEPVEQALMNSNEMATETLQPGVAWHRVVTNENIMSIAFEYGADIEILSQLNPEITFSQCDFGSPSGGPNCIVSIYEGQLVRVPAPTPTATIPPTATGSETPTPTPSPTINAPSLTDPGNLSLFTREQLVTLRWVASGTLAPGQAYRVRLEDLTDGAVYTSDTQDIFFIVPDAWQGTDSRRHEYRWTVSVIDRERPDDPTFTTEARQFSWEGRGASN